MAPFDLCESTKKPLHLGHVKAPNIDLLFPGWNDLRVAANLSNFVVSLATSLSFSFPHSKGNRIKEKLSPNSQ